jgi:hypothetical protein
MHKTADAIRQRSADRSRRKRFQAHFQRWLRGETIQSYDHRWLAYLEHELRTGEAAIPAPATHVLARGKP